MGGKLIKVENTTYYNLENEKGILIGTTFEFKNDVGDDLHSLSFKNCQAIERGYDLDELAENFVSNGGGFKRNFHNEAGWIAASNGYKAGFQKALEILGNKKFSEEDMKNAIQRACNDYNGNIIESLQQTEWEVEIEMEQRKVLVNGYKNQPPDVIGFVADYDLQLVPKLDADGCIILKRK